MRENSLLELRGLRIETTRFHGGRRENIRLLDAVDLDIGARRIVGIVGESGCGKSVTFNAVMGLLPYPLRVTAGEAWFRRAGCAAGGASSTPQNLLALPAGELRAVRGAEIAMIFQEPQSAMDPVYSIGRQIEEALIFHHPEMGKAERNARIVEWLDRVRIPRPREIMASYPHQLSGGQLQRVMIAIALINSPRLLIADEPTTALDVTIQAQILDLMTRLREDSDASIALITHDLGVVAETCEEAAVLYAGEIVERAPVAELFRAPAHPYTQGLLRAGLAERPGGRELAAIPGMVPAAGEWPPGCRFADRCPAAGGACAQEHPALREIAPGHACRCFLGGI